MSPGELPELPRVPLVLAPTPLHLASRLSTELGTEVWFKRDDLTGLGLGGNKVRTLEYLLGDALAQGCTDLVTGAGAQSNWAMLAALAARTVGLVPHLVYYGEEPAPSGNLLLAEKICADVRFTGAPDRASVDSALAELADSLKAGGRKPYVVPRGGATGLGALGYLRASIELAGQLAGEGVRPTQIWVATGSCGTQSGLVAGQRFLGADYDVVGVTTSRPRDECVARVSALQDEIGKIVDLGPATAPAPTVLGGHVGLGYGLPSPAGEQAAAQVAQTEGIFLDPVFGAKAMAALIQTAREGTTTGPVVFLVSGGAPTLFTQPAREEDPL